MPHDDHMHACHVHTPTIAGLSSKIRTRIINNEYESECVNKNHVIDGWSKEDCEVRLRMSAEHECIVSLMVRSFLNMPFAVSVSSDDDEDTSRPRP